MKTIKTSFNAGKLSASLDGRVDISKYYNGCKQITNAIPLSHGGAMKRPGTEFIAKAKGPCRLFPFEFSASDTMMLEFSDEAIRFYKDGDRVMTASVDIAAITLGSGTEVSVQTSASHGFATGDVVRFTGVGGTAELNFAGVNTEWTITVVDADEFTIDGTDGDDFTAFTTGGSVAAIYTLTSPYAIEDVFDIHYIQSADVIYLVHKDYPPKSLSRLADNSWTIADTDLIGGPFLVENTDSTKTLEFARTGGTARDGYYFPAGATGTLTATGHTPFVPTHVGSLWLLRHTRPDNVLETADNDTNATPSGAGIRIKGGFAFEVSVSTNTFKLWRKQGNGSWQQYRSFASDTILSGEEEEEDVFYTFTRSSTDGTATLTAKDQTNRGVVEVTGFTSSSVVSVTVIDPVISNGSDDTAVSTSMWAEGAFSDYRGYPSAIAMHENRLWYAGTISSPQSVWGSKSSKFRNFTDGPLDNDSVQITIEDADVSKIQWLASEEVLLAGTSKKEYKISAGNVDDPITPSDARARPQSSHGSFNLQSVQLNNSIFYFQGNGQRLRMMRFVDTSYRYESDDANLLSNDIFESAPTQFAAQRIPDATLWAVREDGALCSFSYEPKEEIVAWAEHVTGSTLYTPIGYFRSVAIIRGSVEDDIYVTVERVIDGSTVYYIEKLNPRQFGQTDEALMVDSAVVASSDYESKNIVYASDTVRYGSGVYGSGRYGGTD